MREFPNNLVYGFHGTSSARVASILSDGFKPGSMTGDWLGPAVYFWENDAERAALWAERAARRDNAAAVVIRTVIDLSDCLDLTQIRYRTLLAAAAEEFERAWEATGRPDLKQTWGVRELDAAVIGLLASTAVRTDGSPVYTTVRGCFTEGGPLFQVGEATSGINDADHIQIGVLHVSAIQDVDLAYV